MFLVQVQRHVDGVGCHARHVHLPVTVQLFSDMAVRQAQFAQAHLNVFVEHLGRQHAQPLKAQMPQQVDGDALFVGLVGAVGVDQHVGVNETAGFGQGQQLAPGRCGFSRDHAAHPGRTASH